MDTELPCACSYGSVQYVILHQDIHHGVVVIYDVGVTFCDMATVLSSLSAAQAGRRTTGSCCSSLMAGGTDYDLKAPPPNALGHAREVACEQARQQVVMHRLALVLALWHSITC